MLGLWTIKKIALGCISIYQYIIAPYIPNCCIYKLSCSDYTKLQIAQHGTVRGIINGIFRLLNCHPWAIVNDHDQE